MVRVGILKERDQLAPKRQSWFRSARNWVTQHGRDSEEREAGVSASSSGTRERARIR